MPHDPPGPAAGRSPPTQPGAAPGAPATVVVAAGVVIEGGRVLVTQRRRGTHLGGLWELPGGKVHGGEDPRAALERELREELGIETVAGEIVDVTFHRYEEAAKSVLLLFFEATRRAASADPRAIEVEAFEWMAATELEPDRFPPADVPVLRKVRERLIRAAEGQALSVPSGDR